MYRESSKIPYLASMIISQEIDEKVLDDFKDPTKYDVSIYNQYSDNVLERLEQTSRSHTKLAVPTPVPTPAVVPPPMSTTMIVGPPFLSFLLALLLFRSCSVNPYAMAAAVDSEHVPTYPQKPASRQASFIKPI